MPRNFHKNVKCFALMNNGSFTWNTKTRRLVFARAGDPLSEREDARRHDGFFVEGEDIKILYHALHEHFMGPTNMARDWDKRIGKNPPNNHDHKWMNQGGGPTTIELPGEKPDGPKDD